MDGRIATFADRLSEAMDAAGFTQADLRKKVKLSKSTISQYVHGVSKPKRDRTHLIADALGVDPVWLMGYPVPMHPGDSEERLIYNYRELTDEGQQMLINYSKFLLQDHRRD